ncbi:MAG: ATP-binding protein [Isosphaeraceae bacterium]
MRWFSPADFPAVSADASQLQIVFGNLIRNARDAMPNGGTLTISGRIDGSSAEISVSDTGFGISPADLMRITEPLYTTKTRGLGLGLAIVRAILDKNRGELRVVSQPGHGSTFSVRLAVAAPKETQGVASP